MSQLSIKLIKRNSSLESIPLLRVENLSVRIGMRRVLSNISFSLCEGETILIQGINGGGKSSLLNAIAGVEPATIESGFVSFSGCDITHLPAHRISQLGISYLRQRENVFSNLTVEENLLVALGPAGPDRFAEKFPDCREKIPFAKRAALLSGGQRQILAWSMAALRPSRLLMADEPEAGLSQKLPSPDTKALILVSHSNNWLTSHLT